MHHLQQSLLTLEERDVMPEAPPRLLDCGICYEENGEEVHPHPTCNYERLTELEAEHRRWSAVHDLIERAIGKGSTIIYVDLIESELRPVERT